MRLCRAPHDPVYNRRRHARIVQARHRFQLRANCGWPFFRPSERHRRSNGISPRSKPSPRGGVVSTTPGADDSPWPASRPPPSHWCADHRHACGGPARGWSLNQTLAMLSARLSGLCGAVPVSAWRRMTASRQPGEDPISCRRSIHGGRHCQHPSPWRGLLTVPSAARIPLAVMVPDPSEERKRCCVDTAAPKPSRRPRRWSPAARDLGAGAPGAYGVSWWVCRSFSPTGSTIAPQPLHHGCQPLSTQIANRDLDPVGNEKRVGKLSSDAPL